MVAILSDPNFSDSIWWKKIHKSLTDRLREKRIAFCEVFETCPGNPDAVFLITSDPHWTGNVIRQLNEKGIQPILLCNQREDLAGCVYSCVCSDVNASMKNLAEYLQREEKRRVAFCGINPKSLSDLSRVQSLKAWQNDFEAMDFFRMEKSSREHFRDVAKKASRYDAILCANDLAAVSLIHFAKEEGVDLQSCYPLISCASSRISDAYPQEILSLNIHYDAYGKAALDLFDLLQKRPYLSGLTARLAWCLQENEKHPSTEDFIIETPPKSDGLSQDSTFREIAVVERIMAALSDETDREILQGLVNGETYESLEENTFLSKNAVKYRVKRLVEKSGAANKKEMLSLWNQYVCRKD